MDNSSNEINEQQQEVENKIDYCKSDEQIEGNQFKESIIQNNQNDEEMKNNQEVSNIQIDEDQNQNNIENIEQQQNKQSDDETNSNNNQNQNNQVIDHPQVQQTNEQNNEQNVEESKQSEQSQNFSINNLGNHLFLSRESLDAISEFLMLTQKSPFDECLLTVTDLSEKINQLLKEKKKFLEENVSTAMKSFDEFNFQENVNQLEKMVKILKSKEKSIYIRRLQNVGTCECCGQMYSEITNSLTKKSENSQNEQKVEYQEGIIQEDFQKLENEKNCSSETQQIQIDQSKNDQCLDQKEMQQQKFDEQTIQEEKIMNENEQSGIKFDEEQKQQKIQAEYSSKNNPNQLNSLEDIENPAATKLLKMFFNSDEKNQQEQEQKENNQQEKNVPQKMSPMNYRELFSIISMKIFNFSSPSNVSITDDSFVFKFRHVYTVEIKGNFPKVKKRIINSDSRFNDVTSFIMIKHIFPFFSALELFRMRGVCGEWKDLVRETWHFIFRRDIFEQMLIKELTNEFIITQKMTFIREPFVYKIKMLLITIMNSIDWTALNDRINDKNTSSQLKLIIITILKLLGNDLPINSPQQFEEVIWEISAQKAINLGEQINALINSECSLKSKQQLFQLKENFIDNPDLNFEQIAQGDDKTTTLLLIVVYQIYFLSLLKIQFFISKNYLTILSGQLSILNKRQSPNKNFLEDAYKLIFLRSCSIQNGKLMSNEEDKEKENEVYEEIETSIKPEENEATQLFKALQNIDPTQEIGNEPDIVIRLRNYMTKIYIDANTKIDILVSFIYMPKDGYKENDEKESGQLEAQTQTEEPSNQKSLQESDDVNK